MTTRRTFLTAAALAAGALPLARAEEHKEHKEHKGQEGERIQLMFVQTADDLKADDKRIRLVNVGAQTLYFSDRPVRLAGHLPMAAYLESWKPGAGANSFAADPPNATLSVYEGDAKENTLAVIEISAPRLEGNDLVYDYKHIEGTMPKSGGATALFIDWYGLGGGVGPGFHGVGVGFRGPGWR
jgi:hypothetical protein